MNRPRAVVVGGGISGLAAARLLSERWQVQLLESGPRLGGKLAPVWLDGVRLDGGAESFLVRRPEALELVAALGLGDRLVHPTAARPQLLVAGAPVPLPPSVLGVPTDLDALAPVLSPEGLARARREPREAWPPLPGDVAIGQLVDERFGPEVTDRVLEPMLGGVYAGRSRQLSFEAVAHGLFQRARAGGSLLDHARAAARSDQHGPVFGGLPGGVSTLVDALAADLTVRGVEIRTQATVRELRPRPGGGYRLVCGPVPAPAILDADAVVLAVPAGPAGRLLNALVPAAAEWASMPYASTAVVVLVVTGARLTGSGLLVPPGKLPTIKAFTHSSAKWDWVDAAARERWGEDVAVVRASVGRLGEETLLHLPDEALVQRTVAEAQSAPGWSAAHLVAGHVVRWGGSLPQYTVGHRERVARLRAGLRARPGLAVCGAGLDGVGIAACLASAAEAAGMIENSGQEEAR